MRLIDAEPLSKSLADSKAECLEWIKEAEEQGDHELVERAREAMVTFIECRLRVMNAPTIDAVPVVRCKDCRYSDDYYNDGSCCCKHPERGMRYIGTNWNWYCADGERKDDELQTD